MSLPANTLFICTNEYVQGDFNQFCEVPLGPKFVGIGRKTDSKWQVHGVTFKKRAPRAIKAIKEFAEKAMVCLATFISQAQNC